MILIPLFLVPIAAILGMAAAWGRSRIEAAIVVSMSVANLAAVWHAMPHAEAGLDYVLGGWPAGIGIALRLDMLSAVMLALTACVMTAATLYHLGSTLEGSKGTENPVYHLTFPLVLLALNGLFLTHDLFNFYVFFELLAVSSYVLVAVGKYFPREAAWKYAVQSIVGSTALLIGVAVIYAHAGTLHMSDASAALTAPPAHAAPFFLAAFLLKGSLFPFHFWQQDAHAAATSPGSAVLAGLLINVGMYGLMRVWPLLFGTDFHGVLVWLGAASIVFGAVAAWQQADAKRLLGFSSVSQLGFVLLGLGWGTVGTTAAALLFLVHHSVSKALLFLCTGALSDPRGGAQLQVLRGTGRGLPWLQVGFGVGALSLVGMPPTIGLVGKLVLLKEGFELMRWPGAALILVGSLLTLGYASRAHRILFWEQAQGSQPSAAAVPTLVGMAIALLALMVLLGGAAGGGIWTLCQAAARVSLSMRGAP